MARWTSIAYDSAVSNILKTKFQLGLFENPYTDADQLPPYADKPALKAARKAALQSVVLLKNDHGVLPLSAEQLNTVALIGPLSDAPYQQLGTWIFDGDESLSITPMHAIHSLVGKRRRCSLCACHANIAKPRERVV